MNPHRTLSTLMVVLTGLTATATDLETNIGAWRISMDSRKTITISRDGQTLLTGVYAEADNAAGLRLDSREYPNVTLSTENISDAFGEGKKAVYHYSGRAGAEDLRQVFYLYPDKQYLTTELYLDSPSGKTESRYMAPIATALTNTFLPSGGRQQDV